MYTLYKKHGWKGMHSTKSSTATTSSDTTEAKAIITFAVLPSYYLHDITMDGKMPAPDPQ
jgi:hypothetical protein